MKSKKKEWNEDEENILKLLSEKCFTMSEYHKKEYIRYKNILKYYKIPVIIISGINSVIAVGMSDYISQQVISAINCILSLLCGVICSIELYLKISDNMNSEFISGRDFHLMHIDITKTLALDEQNRGIAGHIYLNNIYSRYVETLSKAQTMTGVSLIHDFKEQYNVDRDENNCPVLIPKKTIELKTKTT